MTPLPIAHPRIWSAQFDAPLKQAEIIDAAITGLNISPTSMMPAEYYVPLSSEDALHLAAALCLIHPEDLASHLSNSDSHNEGLGYRAVPANVSVVAEVKSVLGPLVDALALTNIHDDGASFPINPKKLVDGFVLFFTSQSALAMYWPA